MKHQLLDIEAELSQAFMDLSAGDYAGAKRKIKAAQLALIALAELEEQTENTKPQEN